MRGIHASPPLTPSARKARRGRPQKRAASQFSIAHPLFPDISKNHAPICPPKPWQRWMRLNNSKISLINGNSIIIVYFWFFAVSSGIEFAGRNEPFFYPEGIKSLSPALRRRSYAGSSIHQSHQLCRSCICYSSIIRRRSPEPDKKNAQAADNSTNLRGREDAFLASKSNACGFQAGVGPI
jgi:hypothetical protein